MIEDSKVAGGLSTDEALAHVAAVMLRGWNGFPAYELSATTGALFRERLSIVRGETDAEAAT